MVERIPITDVRPLVEHGRYPVKATTGETLTVTANVFREGHDLLGAGVVLTDPRGKDRPLVPMAKTDEPDSYTADVTPDAEGAWTYRIESWSDPYATWRHAAEIKIAAEIDVELMLIEGAIVLERAAKSVPAKLKPAAHDTDLRRQGRARHQAPGAGPTGGAHLPRGGRRPAAPPTPRPRLAARAPTRCTSTGCGRSTAPGTSSSRAPRVRRTTRRPSGCESGTFTTAAKRLDAVADMGFDVIYLPPIHPIGEVNRKGPNNTLTPGPDDPGSTWAIGSKDGGHDAIHRDLGTIEDFDAFVTRAKQVGLEVALDLALQCAPDHPWATEHPEWFTTRADGTIAYAENPPKKYQDIYPLNFDNDFEGLSHEVLRVVRYWMDHGVRIFRVDNPHTKPVMFWEWLLARGPHAPTPT